MSHTLDGAARTSRANSSDFELKTLEKNEEKPVSASSPSDTESVTLEKYEEPAPIRAQGVKWVLVLAAIFSSMFLFALDNTIVADIQPAIVAEFDEIAKLPWLAGAFIMGTAASNLVWGKVFSNFEAKYAYLLNLVIFEVGSAICGAAPTMNALIVGRAIAGVGGSGLYVGINTLISVTTTMQERPMYVSLNGLVWGVGTVLGPIIGGAFAVSSAGWRWAFYINLCIGALFTPIYLFMLPKSDPRKGDPQLQRLKELDWVGTILTVGGFVALMMALASGGTIYAWNSGQTIALFVVAGVVFITLAIQQELAIFTTPERRLFPVQFLRSRTMVLLFILTACGGVGIVVTLYM